MKCAILKILLGSTPELTQLTVQVRDGTKSEIIMSGEKTLYLHIGCGKTGSSALQVWLNNEAGALRRQDLDYPFWSSKKLDAYAITSGNGVKLLQAIQAGELPAFMEQLAQSRCGKILLSSETFQGFSDETLVALKQAAFQHGLRVSIVAYVRDVYDIVYSLYLQAVKRHLGHATFREAGLRLKSIQQFEVLQKYRRHFDDASIQVLHYDTERKRGLEVSMCEALGIDPASIPPMPPTKVNRSLDVFEAELLRIANKHYVQSSGRPQGATRFSTRVSDLLIYRDPERETEILLDEDVLEHVRSICQPAIDDINRTFLRDAQLSLFSAEGKRVVKEVPVLPAAYELVLEGVVKFLESDEAPASEEPAGGKLRKQAPEKNQLIEAAAGTKKSAANEPLDCSDPRLANALRDEAIRVEKSDPSRALALMSAAAALRPNGGLIKKKLEEYRSLTL